jgi:hypothetical protein
MSSGSPRRWPLSTRPKSATSTWQSRRPRWLPVLPRRHIRLQGIARIMQVAGMSKGDLPQVMSQARYYYH